MTSKILAGAILLALAPALAAVRVKQVEKGSLAEFQKGSFVNVSIDGSGLLTLGPRLKGVAGPAEEFYLSAAAGGNGELYLGTGHHAAVYRLGADGKADKIFQGEQLDVYALLVAANGDLLVGTSPNGRVFRINKERKASELFRPDEKFIWDLAEDAQGNILCALGNTGAVFSIGKNGTAENLLTAEDAHIVRLHVTRDGAVLAGSGDRGILYEIRNRKVRVLFDSPLEEIKGIASDGEGNVYFAAVRGVPAPQAAKEIEIGAPAAAKAENAEKEPPRERSILYLLRPDGVVETLWSSTEEIIYDVYYDAQAQAAVIGTGNAGRVYRVDRSGAFSQLCESESAQVYRIAGGAPGRGYFLVANNTPAVTQVEAVPSSSGTYYSEVFDARIQSRFGRLTWNAEGGGAGAVSFAVRLGNSDYPDRSWTAWSAPFTDPENSLIATGGYRFLQVKIVLSAASPGSGPLLSGYRIHYLTDNLRPEVGTPLVQRPGERKPVADTTPPRKYLHVTWEASDPNQDRLNYTLSLRRLPGNDWLTLRKDLRERWYYLDCELFADGKYQLKVQADDGLDNAPAWARSAARSSAPFILDSTAPLLAEFAVEGRSVRFRAADEASAVAAAWYSLDGREWVPLLPDDQVGDSRSESFRFELAGGAGPRALFIKLSDELGNEKVFQKTI
ncbi:MAG TPA: hypothetical protein PK919_09430 [Candidatus Aminicenantes bacterium]|nr:hypothetical protein [Candidatus Aminicenantes bacterium]